VGAILKSRRLFIGGHNPEGRVFASDGAGLRAVLGRSFEIVERLEQVRSNDLYLAIDSDWKELKTLERMGISKPQRCAVLFEPESALPWQSAVKVEKNFDLSVWVGRPQSDNSEFWPQVFENPAARETRRDIPVMLAANKISFSGGELYSLRREVARKLDSIEVWGVGWGQTKTEALINYLASLGQHIATTCSLPKTSNFDYFASSPPSRWADSKQKVLNSSRYSIVIENSFEYSSEKPFDSIKAMSIPIYVGPRGGLPKEIEALCVFSTETLEGVADALLLARKIDYEAWSRRAHEALRSTTIREQISEEAVFERIVRKLVLWAEQRSQRGA
jgi:hypothetical protein